MADQQSHVTVGVDSHKDVHVAAVIDQVGQILATTSMATTDRGSGQLVRWAQRHGQVDRFGVEGTGSFAAGLTRYLRARGYQVLEVNRPNRQTRRRRGKSDTVDAESAARAALAGQASTPKAADGTVEMIRALRVARRSAIRPVPRPPTSSTAWSSPHLRSCGSNCAGWRPPDGSRSPRRFGPGRSPPRSRPPSSPWESWPAGISP